MVSIRGIVIGFLVMIFGFLVTFTAVSSDFLFSLGLINIKMFNLIQQQVGMWMPALGVMIIIIGLVIMGKF